MTVDPAILRNEGDFYSPHYLESVFEKDLQDLRKRWKERDESGSSADPSPQKRLLATRRAWFAHKGRALRHLRPGDLDAFADERFEPSLEAAILVLEALGYERTPHLWLSTGPKEALPVLFDLRRAGRRHVVGVAGLFVDENESARRQRLAEASLPPAARDDAFHLPRDKDGGYLRQESVPARLFKLEDPPRFVLLFLGRELHLIDRQKWSNGAALVFDLDTLLGRGDQTAAFQLAALVAKETLSPDADDLLHDTLGENSHKHAFQVSGDLKEGVRHAVELLANDYVRWARENKKAVFNDPDLARKLKDQSLRYVYRLLFLLYAEARGREIGVVPIDDEIYAKGYSLESLRDLELVPLDSEAAQAGSFLDRSLKRLFSLIHDGDPFGDAAQHAVGHAEHGLFLRAQPHSLFDPKETPELSSCTFRNDVLQQVIRALSLSREGKNRGRISYAQLGINQLGEVYESLLAYSGLFATERLYEVSDAKRTKGVFLVPESELHRYKEDEFITESRPDGTSARRVHEKGAFVFRLAGRDRQASASYYTPEVLTRCVTEHTLAEWKKHHPAADDVLNVRLLEPAVGSGAFLSEGLNQLADLYLDRKLAETGATLDSEARREQHRRVKDWMSRSCAYGVDLNATAQELATVSLWLASITKGATPPDYRLRIVTGNALVGAWRRVYAVSDLRAKSGEPPYRSKPPDLLPPPALKRPPATVYHFLLPDPSMAPVGSDKIAKELCPAETKAMREWTKAFTKPLAEHEIARLERLSDLVDQTFAAHRVERLRLLRETAAPRRFLGFDDAFTPTKTPAQAAAELARATAPGRRLARVMDAWCAFFFWPPQKAALLPSRDEWLKTLERLLTEEDLGTSEGEQGILFAADKPRRDTWGDSRRLTDVERVASDHAWLAEVAALAEEHRFFHYEIAFPEVLVPDAPRAPGFDLQLGNPPWIKVEWQEATLLSDYDPRTELDDLSAPDVAKLRPDLLKPDPDRLTAYTEALAGFSGTKAFMNLTAVYPLLQGVQTNLYKGFITRAFELEAESGAAGFVHPEGGYDDPRGGKLRRAVFPRLRSHFHFSNELQLFAETDHKMSPFGIHIYGDAQTVAFRSITNLFHPDTINRSLAHDGRGQVPGIKTDQGDWDTRGHAQRVLTIDLEKLALFAKLYDEPGTPPEEARLPAIHAESIIEVLQKFATQPRRVGDLTYFPTEMWHETGAVKDGTIRRQTSWPMSPTEWIVQGPHFFVGTPLNKTPRAVCTANGHYDEISLTEIPDDYLPRTNYFPACPPAEYAARIPLTPGTFPHDKRSRPVTDFYRHVHREMLSLTNERTVLGALIPPGVTHIHAVYSMTFADYAQLVMVQGLLDSLVYDFLVRTTGKGHLQDNLVCNLPFPDFAHNAKRVLARVLRLNCVTSHYAPLWSELWDPAFAEDRFTSDDPRLEGWSHLTKDWSRATPLRTDLSRRQALVELDALAALAMGISEEDLLLIYRVQFPVLQQYERDNRYDQRGHLVPDKLLQSLAKSPTTPTSPYIPPFTSRDRSADLSAAYSRFSLENRVGSDPKSAGTNTTG